MEQKIRVSQAVKFLKEKGLSVSGMTIRNWIKKFGIGEKIGGFWYTTINELEKVLNGEIKQTYTTDKFKKD